jgi:predicted secreted protein
MVKRHPITEEKPDISGVSVNDDIIVALIETPTTGFRWHLEVSPNLVVLSESFDPMGQAVGGSGLRHVTFHAVAAGPAHINAKLWRSWEGDASAIRRLVFSFRID